MERHRIYDIVNVLESVGILMRKAKKWYSWIGFCRVPKALRELTVDSANKYGILLEVVQILTELKLIVKKAYKSLDGGWITYRWCSTISAVVDDTKVVVAGAGVTRVAFERAMVGRTIVAAQRRGKNLWLSLDAPPFPSFQSVVSSTDEWPSKYSKFFVELDDGLEFSFTDKRRFARVRLFEDSFISGFNEQSFISGIGNWIADEVLYQSRIHPLQVASSLSREICEALHRSIQKVVKYAVEVDADCDRFPEDWLFHHRWGKKPGKVNVEQKNLDVNFELEADTSPPKDQRREYIPCQDTKT
ncbi:hypothetical protein ABZP36_007776 [Zizania latifolia]